MTLEEKLHQLTLTTMAQNLETMTAQAANQNLSFAAALERLADLELEARRQRSIERRFKLSHLPTQPTLDQFHFSHHKSRQQARNRILRLLDLDFLKQGTSVVIIGNPGVGKTFWPTSSAGAPAKPTCASSSPPPWTCSTNCWPLRSITP